MKQYMRHTYLVTVTEAATVWYVTLNRWGWENPHLLNYKVTKKQAKTLDEACDVAFVQGLGC